MDIQLTKEEGRDVVALAGELDGSSSRPVQEAITPLLVSGARVLVDMTKVNYLSSAGLRCMLIIYREGEEKGGRLVLTGLSDEIRDTMTLTGFLKFFPVGATREESVKLLDAPQPPAASAAA